MKNGLVLITLFIMSLIFIVGCDSNKSDSKNILDKMDKSIQEADAISIDEIIGDTSGLDPVRINIYSDEAYEIVRIISEKILDSNEKDTGVLYDEYVLSIYYGDFFIEYQGNASIYHVNEEGEKILVKTAYNAGKSISESVQELITLIKSQK